MVQMSGNYMTDVTLWAVFTTWMVNNAVLGSCPMGFFGYLCQYQCHCAYGAACHTSTGECFEDCDFGWKGQPTCQIQNIALDKVTYQTGHNTSVLAVDGSRSQNGTTGKCTRAYGTSNVFRVKWFVDLGKEYHIKQIRVFFRNDQIQNKGRRMGARVYVSNTPTFTNGAMCYTSQLQAKKFFSPPDVLTLNNCTHKARYVTLYNQRPIVNPAACPITDYSCWANLELCEVEVYACAYGTYGSNCQHLCNCKGETCDPDTGICPSGCSEGRMGPRCDQECPPGRYGVDCAKFCANCLDGKPCNTISGRCPNDQCSPGWTGFLCDRACKKYKYGKNCEQDCGNCKGLVDCDKITGICRDGCHTNWYGPNCNYSCPLGTYGGDCDKPCGNCADNENCHSTTGACPHGCSPGFMSDLCNIKCPSFTFGEGCSERCGNCRNGQTCDPVTGHCSSGCMPGYSGAFCNTVCEEGRYGEDCRFSCDNCRDTKCHHITGQCLNDCGPGLRNPPFCDEDCSPGMYGDKCINICGPCKDDKPCHHVTGDCTNGCQAGWQGTGCTDACPTSKYGMGCNSDCGSCALNSTCNPVDGTCPGGCRDGYSGARCTSLMSRQTASSDVMIGSISGAAAFAVIIVVLLFVFIRRKKKVPSPGVTPGNNTPGMNTQYENVGFGNLADLDQRSFRISASSAVYYNLDINRGVHIGHLNEYIHMMETNPDKYQNQFDELKDCPRFLHIEGQKKENKMKNRFLTTYPYDHSRVILEKQKEEPSDYINASFIDSMDERKRYIATQGPKANTVYDFWRMVWQENVHLIVMLTNLVEDGKVKCEKYWPEDGPLCFGKLEIKLRRVTESASFIVRQMMISHQDGSSRALWQYHFTGWPDHGIPETLDLVHFIRQCQSCKLYGTGPMLVHCSAGVGRTGTFIALDALYRHGEKTEYVEILGFIKRMRECRMSMIQNVDQYRLLHFALLEAFTYRDTSIPVSEFTERYNHLSQRQSHILYEEFRDLNETKPKYTSVDWPSALSDENQNKNRNSVILAVDQFRPYLNTYIPGTTDYINAVLIPSLKSDVQYIVTQCPLPETVVDLWRLVYDHDINIIVSLSFLDEDQEGTVVWWPSEGEAVNYGPIVIKTQSVDHLHTGYSARCFQVLKLGTSDIRTVTSFHLSNWPADRQTPQSMASFLSMIRAVDETMTESSNVLVMCMDGAKCSGLFCSLTHVLDRMKLERSVDIFHTVRKLQIRCPHFISNMEQYSYLYEAVSEHINSTVYGNL